MALECGCGDSFIMNVVVVGECGDSCICNGAVYDFVYDCICI